MKSLFNKTALAIMVATTIISCSKENVMQEPKMPMEGLKTAYSTNPNKSDTPYVSGAKLDTPYVSGIKLDTPYVAGNLHKGADTPYLGHKLVDTPYINGTHKNLDTPYVVTKSLDTPYMRR
jgi:hypothetical protein